MPNPVARVIAKIKEGGLDEHLPVAEKIAEWSVEHRMQPKPEPTTSKGSVVALHVKGVPDWAAVFKMYSTGRGVVPLAHLAKQRPFNSAVMQDELRARLESAPGKWKKLKADFPEVDLSTLGDAGLEKLFDTLEWIESEIRRVHAY